MATKSARVNTSKLSLKNLRPLRLKAPVPSKLMSSCQRPRSMNSTSTAPITFDLTARLANRHGRYTDRPNLDRRSQGKAWKWSVLTVGAIVIIVAVAYGSYSGRFSTTDQIANATIDQGR